MFFPTSNIRPPTSKPEVNGMSDDRTYYKPEDFNKLMVKEARAAYDVSAEKLTFDIVSKWKAGEGERWELLNGMPIKMQSPSPRHQEISGELFAMFREYLKGKSCKIFSAIDARLNYDTSDDTYFAPDLVVLCDRKKLDRTGIKGVPDLVIEILSPSTRRYDILVKRREYEKAGVKEYWLVDQEDGVVEVALLNEDGFYRSRTYSNKESIKVGILEDLVINLADVLEDLWAD